jgi:hypothetical protein
MNSRTYIRKKKRTTSTGVWASGAVQKGKFPIFRSAYPLGSAWRWRSAELSSGSEEYRLLVMLRLDKPNYKAWLAVKIRSDWAVVGRLESHHDHGGLHCHLQCLETGVVMGRIDPPDAISVPHWKAHHRTRNAISSETVAWETALRFFRAQTAEVGLLGL